MVERFEPVGQGFEHDGAVVVVGRFEAGDMGADADAGGKGKRADVIGQAAVFGGDKVGQGKLWAVALALGSLLAQVRPPADDSLERALIFAALPTTESTQALASPQDARPTGNPLPGTGSALPVPVTLRNSVVPFVEIAPALFSHEPGGR